MPGITKHAYFLFPVLGFWVGNRFRRRSGLLGHRGRGGEQRTAGGLPGRNLRGDAAVLGVLGETFGE